MAVQLTLTDISSGYQGSDIQANFTAIEDEFDKVLYRNGDLTVTDTIDMNSQRLVNLPAPTSSTEPLRKDDQFTTDEAQQFATDAETAKDDAETALFNFQDRWLGPSATEPTQDGNGNALEEGDLYFDTDEDVLMAYDGANWVVSANQYFPFVDDMVTTNEDELNILTFATLTTDELNILDGVTAGTEEINKLDGATWTTAESNTVLAPYDSQRIELGGEFTAGEEIVCERIGNTVTVTAVGFLSHSSTATPTSTATVIPSQFCPSDTVGDVIDSQSGHVTRVFIVSGGTLSLRHRDYTGTDSAQTGVNGFTISYVIADNIA